MFLVTEHKDGTRSAIEIDKNARVHSAANTKIIESITEPNIIKVLSDDGDHEYWPVCESAKRYPEILQRMMLDINNVGVTYRKLQKLALKEACK